MGCYLCAAVCPVDCIALQATEDEHGRRYPEFFRINFSRCIFCGFCEDACPTYAIQLTPDFEMGEYQRPNLVYEKEESADQRPGKISRTTTSGVSAVWRSAGRTRANPSTRRPPPIFIGFCPDYLMDAAVLYCGSDCDYRHAADDHPAERRACAALPDRLAAGSSSVSTRWERPFVAALEVIIYAGAIMVLFIFVVMMLNLGEEQSRWSGCWLMPRMWIGPCILAAILIAELTYLLIASRIRRQGTASVQPKTGRHGPVRTVSDRRGTGLHASAGRHRGRLSSGRKTGRTGDAICHRFRWQHGLLLAAILFALGLIGLLVRRNLIFTLMSIEVMLNAAGLAFVVAGGALGAAGRSGHVPLHSGDGSG